jgi:hypothetical protein
VFYGLILSFALVMVGGFAIMFLGLTTSFMLWGVAFLAYLDPAGWFSATWHYVQANPGQAIIIGLLGLLWVELHSLVNHDYWFLRRLKLVASGTRFNRVNRDYGHMAANSKRRSDLPHGSLRNRAFWAGSASTDISHTG